MEGGLLDETLRRRRLLVLLLTFLAYTCFHASRKPAGVVKGILHPVGDSGVSAYDPVAHHGWSPFVDDLVPQKVSQAGYSVAGAGISEVDGTFSCGQLDDSGICLMYQQGKYILAPESNPVVLEALGYGGMSSIWVIRTSDVDQPFCQPTPPGLEGTCLLYAQPSETPIPAPCGSNGNKEVQTNWATVTPMAGDAPRVVPLLPDGTTLLGYCDTVYLGSYAIAMFVTGVLADHMSLRLFLFIAVMGSSIWVAMIGMAYYWDIHHFSYFLVAYGVQGVFQSMAWPAVAAIVGPWVAHGSRGLVLGVWNCSTYVGNIAGGALSALALSIGSNHHENWAMAFLVCAAVLFVCGTLVASVVTIRPKDVMIELDEEGLPEDEEDPAEEVQKGMIAGFWRALLIPGVIEYSLSLFFIKLVCYALVYWLPYYLSAQGYGAQDAGYLSVFIDVGSIIGGILIGYLSDHWNVPALISCIFMLLCVPALWGYRLLTAITGHHASWANAIALMVLGALPNGPYTLITNAVAVDLGQSGRGTELATVIAIIDATGSLGAAVQGIAVAAITTRFGWNAVFHSFIVCCFLSALFLVRLVKHEWKQQR